MSLATVGTYRSEAEANLIKAKLAAHGIEASVETPLFSATFPHMDVFEGVRVIVRESDLPDALTVLERMLPGGDQEPHTSR
ncbi:MAG: DUF2007 domain-containing protein [Acidimicrobiia bacterium]|nr:DUF2007 domain-containing protein [Acidimicrobiia bacterium]